MCHAKSLPPLHLFSAIASTPVSFGVATPNVQRPPIGRRVMLRHLRHFNRTLYLFIIFIGYNGAHL